MTSPALGLVAAFALLATAPVAQTVHVANNDTELQTALSASASGDTILVRFANGGDVTIQGKSLIVVGDITPKPRLGRLVIRDLAANQQVTIDDLRFDGPPAVPAIELIDNAGFVWLEDSRGTGGDGALTLPCEPGGVGMWVEGCAAVTAVSCTFDGGEGSDTDNGPSGCAAAKAGGAGVLVQSSRANLHDCIVRGGHGGSDVNNVQGAPGASALEAVSNAQVVLSSSPPKGGSGGDNCTAGFSFQCRGGDGLFVDGTSTVYWQDGDPSGGNGGALVGGGNAADGIALELLFGGVATEWISPARILEVNSAVHFGDTATLTYTGVVGDTFAVYYARGQGYHLQLPNHGVFALNAGFAGPFTIVTVTDPGGVYTMNYPVLDPNDYGLDAMTFYLQAYAQDSAGDVRLSGPTDLVMLAAGI